MFSRRLRVFIAALLTMSTFVIANGSIANAALPSPFDTTFGTDGIALPELPLQRSESQATDVIQDQSGNFYALLVADGGNNSALTTVAKFSSNGIPTSGYGTAGRSIQLNLVGASFAIQADGKILVSGFQFSNNQMRLIVYRLATTGQIDTTFGVDGAYSITSFPGKNIWSPTLLLAVNQNNDRIHLAFNVSNIQDNNQNFYFITLNSDGELDYDWSNGGAEEIVPRGGPVSAYSTLTDIQLLSDGSLVGIGSAISTNGVRAVVLTKLGQNGFLDQSFDGASNGNGIVFIQFGSESDAYLTAGVVLQDDSMVLAGSAGTYYYGPWYYGAMKVSADGNVDTSFGTNGFTLSTLQTDYSSYLPKRIGMQPDGRFIFNINTGTTGGFMRLESDGTVGNGPNCSQCLWSGSNDGAMATSLSVQTDGKVIVTGQHRTDKNILVRRLTSAGLADGTFNNSNIQIDAERWTMYLSKVRPQPDGSIYALGGARVDRGGTSVERVAVFKFTSNGAFDVQFGRGGYQFLAPPNDNYWVSSDDFQILSNGKILVLGSGSSNQDNVDSSVMLWQLNANGNLDTSFGSNGFTITSESGAELYPISFVLDSNGRILIPISRSVNYVGSPWVYRYTASGLLDSSFTDSQNFAGGVKPTIGDNTGYISCVRATSNGKFFVAGSTNINSQAHSYLARFHADGTLDTTFSNGYVTWDAQLANSMNYISNVHTTSDGKVFVIGSTTAPTQSGLLVQLNSDGSLNPTFNGNGRLTISFRDPAQVEYSNPVAFVINDDVMTILGGGDSDVRQYRSASFSAVARFSTTGTPDSNFGTAGIVEPFSTQENYLADIAATPDGKHVIVGSIRDGSNGHSVLLRIGASSTPTTTTPPTTTPATTQPPASTTTTTLPIKTAAPVVQDTEIKLVISVSQTAILKRMKLTVPKGSKVSMKVSTPKVCRVSKTKVVASATGTCRVSVTLTDKKKKKTTKTTSFKVT